ncbi:acetylornithine transaminase [Paenibacillus aurantius]|uniref:Acetylornithine aminotransferase n=1 Tax=Paenibacillus aurantius TaxID=2918900 RepID=A0AA96LGE9_9BACL|nr:acetylornithine transaminase [Paenibacillus aurantius]WNQ11615.1 acetylornithine transaminase [Paenibacillus aurantius]
MGEQQSALFPTYARYPITIVKGEGSRLWDDNGKEYLDFMSGLAVTSLGHAPKAIKEKLIEQLDQLWHVSNLFHIPNQEKLAALLTANSCLDRAFFCSTGAEANEAAIKIARRYNQKVLGRDRHEIITFHQSFHGRTLATLTATGQDKVKEGFLPLPQGFVYAPYNVIEGLESYIGDKTCAIMLEMIQAEGGVITADPAFVQEVVRLCQKYDLLLIVDEIQTGMGRTGKLFAYEHYGIEPDIITLAKALGSGFPIGAMLGKEKLAEAFSAGSHGSTFGGTPIATATAIATVETIVGEKLSERAAEKGEYLFAKLTEALKGNDFVKEIRGKGLIVGILCAGPVAEQIADIHRNGLLVVSAGPDVIRLLPNLLVSEDEIDRAVETISRVLAAKAQTAV